MYSAEKKIFSRQGFSRKTKSIGDIDIDTDRSGFIMRDWVT